MIINAPLRLTDKWGSGAYQSSRGGRTHNGIDVACYKGSGVLSVSDGFITKIGYPHDPSHPTKGHLRYVQVTDDGGCNARYFYVQPLVAVGDKINQGDLLGVTQGLDKIYPGITDHYHFEVKRPSGRFMDPALYLTQIE